MTSGIGPSASLKGAKKERARKSEYASEKSMHGSGDGLPPQQYQRTPGAGALPTMHQLADDLHPTGSHMDGMRYQPTPPAGKVP
jgi:hypothetical protein